MTITLGKNKQINCSKSTFYKFLGYLARHPNDIKIVHEMNSEQGAWGDESRIQFKSDFVRTNFSHLGINVTAGVGKIDSRLNCNELINLLYKLGFQPGSAQDIDTIRRRIPADYINDFNSGI